MTRLVNRPIVVEQWKNDLPAAFSDGTTLHRIETYIDMWAETGYWWNGEGTRQMFRVYTHRNQVFDLECIQDNSGTQEQDCSSQAKWFIYKVWD